MSDIPTLPSCCIQTPACGACGRDTEQDGDSFYCDDCGLDYGDGAENRATYQDEGAAPCAHPCDNSWHGENLITRGWTSDCKPCSLPTGHNSDHWTPCEAKRVEA